MMGIGWGDDDHYSGPAYSSLPDWLRGLLVMLVCGTILIVAGISVSANGW